MKINIWKLLLVAMVVPAVMGACKDDRNNYMVDDSISFVDSDGTWEASDDKPQGYISIPAYGETYQFPVVKNGKGLSSTTVRLEASESALAAFNEANGTNMVALPSNCYTLETTQLNFSKEDVRKFATINWDLAAISALDPDTNYVIPIQLTSTASDVPVSEERGLMLLHLALADVSMSLLDTGMTTVANGTFVYNGNVSLSVPVSTMDVEVKYAIDTDPAVVEAYNAANGTTFAAVSEGFASMTSASSVIKAGETTAPFACQLNLDQLLASVDKMDDGVLVPVRISSVTTGVYIGSDIVYIPVKNGEIKGPWTLLEGEEIGWAYGPTNPGNATYTGSRLFDGSLTDEWIPFINGNDQNEFPMVFVADMGAAHIFTNFLIADSFNFQGSYRDYEIYVSETYEGASTQWTKVASGMRDYTYCVEANTAPVVKDHPGLTYNYPVQKIAVGRYLKFQINRCEPTRDNGIDPSPCGGGKLADVWGEGL